MLGRNIGGFPPHPPSQVSDPKAQLTAQLTTFGRFFRSPFPPVLDPLW